MPKPMNTYFKLGLIFDAMTSPFDANVAMHLSPHQRRELSELQGRIQ